MRCGTSIGCALALLASAATQASGVNGIDNEVPNRISMNVTVPRQTQGASFGEKADAGLHAAGSAVTAGMPLTILIECGQAACVVRLPDGGGYRADLQRRRVEVLKANRQGDADANRGIGQGAALLGAAVPGGSIVSAGLSAVGTPSGSGSWLAAASDGAPGRPGRAPILLPSTPCAGDADVTGRAPPPGVTHEYHHVKPLSEGDYQLCLVVRDGTRRARIRNAGKFGGTPGTVQIDVLLRVEGGVLRTAHDIAKGTIGNVR